MKGRLNELLRVVGELGLDAFLLQNTDEYQSEFLARSMQRVRWLCGFTGSNAFLIICKNGKSQFFTDSRYTVQSAIEVDQSEYEIHDFREITPWEWLEKNLRSDAIVGYDGALFTLSQIRKYSKFRLKLLPEITLDKLWSRDIQVSQNVVEHPVKFSGIPSSEKRSLIASNIPQRHVVLMTDVSAISWLLNIRNLECPRNPAVMSRAILYPDGSAELFIDNTLGKLTNDGVKVLSLDQLPKKLAELDGNVLVDASTIPMAIFNIVKSKASVLGSDLCTLPKAVKNSIEIQGMINAHIRDGVAVINLLYWLYCELDKGKKITELDVVSRLSELRKEQDMCLGESFDTISGFGSNGAIVHYIASEKTNKVLEEGSLYLLDSGGQYLDGTTDITRTLAIGTPTREHMENFTWVLKGHIALASAVFPVGTSGAALDVLARQYLWKKNLDYRHSTGHGVGSCLSVHEGPQGIFQGNSVGLVPGMVLSNEPGYYKTGKYGIRIENVMYVKEGSGNFCEFAQLTCVPIDTNLIDVGMLNSEEIKYIDTYHQFCYDSVAHLLSSVEVKQWLEAACKPIVAA